MVKIDNITKFGLAERAFELKTSGLSNKKVAVMLTEESKETITSMAVDRFFRSNKDIFPRNPVKSVDITNLQVKLAESEMSTLDMRKEIITGLLGLARSTQNEDIKQKAYKEANIAVNSLDASLGKMNPGLHINFNSVNLNGVPELTDEDLREIMANGRKTQSRIGGCGSFGTIEEAQWTEESD